MKILALDIGGTFIKAALMSETAEILKRWKIPSLTDSLEQLFESLDECILPYKDQIDGIAISMPGRINANTGFAYTGGAFQFIQNLDLGNKIHERYCLPITIDNDGNCAANAENWIGSLKDVENGMIYVLGTGIGGGLIIHNKVYRGFHYAAGEISCNLIHKTEFPGPENQICRLGSTIEFIEKYKKDVNEDNIDGFEFFRRVNAGDKKANAHLREFAKITANSFYDLQVILDLERFAIGGGISTQPLLLQYIQEEMDKIWDTEYPLPCIQPDVVVCKFGNDANLIGALKHFLDSRKD